MESKQSSISKEFSQYIQKFQSLANRLRSEHSNRSLYIDFLKTDLKRSQRRISWRTHH